jgi:hypothetical protein
MLTAMPAPLEADDDEEEEALPPHASLIKAMHALASPS